MAFEYLCPDDHSFYCPGKGCVLNKAACDSAVRTVSKPGYKTSGTPVLPRMEYKSMNAQYLLKELSNITAWNGQIVDSNVIRFCAKMYDQCLWVKLVKQCTESANCLKNENKFFEKELSKYTPHIVQCVASKIDISDDIPLSNKPDMDMIISQINKFRKEDVIGAFYMQPEKWVYLESFMDLNRFIVTQDMVISILFQIVFTIACLQSKKVIHGNLNKPKTIALDLRPREKSITYFRNSVKYVVPINVKVIILHWENVKEGADNSDIKTVCEHVKMLLSKHPDSDNVNAFLQADKSADELLENNTLFKRYQAYHSK